MPGSPGDLLGPKARSRSELNDLAMVQRHRAKCLTHLLDLLEPTPGDFGATVVTPATKEPIVVLAGAGPVVLDLLLKDSRVRGHDSILSRAPGVVASDAGDRASSRVARLNPPDAGKSTRPTSATTSPGPDEAAHVRTDFDPEAAAVRLLLVERVTGQN